jgi:hypothetical protein
MLEIIRLRKYSKFYNLFLDRLSFYKISNEISVFGFSKNEDGFCFIT